MVWEGAKECTAVVKSPLADLVDRGVSAERGLLAVADGGKALSAGLRRVFGNKV
jgi:putative transposase